MASGSGSARAGNWGRGVAGLAAGQGRKRQGGPAGHLHSPRRQHGAVKPDGDPTSKFRPQPHASKSVRSPPDGDYRNFEDEGFKVDNDENPMPKWAKDAKNAHSAGSKEALDFMDGMADNSHTNLTQG
jgi:hypothetical protein